MSPVPQAELVALKALSGYDQMLEMDRICRVYGTDEATVQAAMAALSTSSQHLGHESQRGPWAAIHIASFRPQPGG